MNQFWKWTAVAAALGTAAFAQKVKSPKEGEALMAIQNSTTPEDRMAAIENLLTKFADTEFKVIVLEIAADTAQQKNDAVQTVLYCERILEVDSKNLNAIASLAKVTASGIRENDLDKEDKLKRVDELTGQCLKLAPDAKKPNAMLTDDQWVARKNDFTADCHDALAATSILRKKPDAAMAEYKASLGLRKDPATMVRMAQVLNAQAKYDDSIALLEQVQAIPDVNPVVKQVAGNERVKAIMARQKVKAAEAPKPQ